MARVVVSEEVTLAPPAASTLAAPAQARVRVPSAVRSRRISMEVEPPPRAVLRAFVPAVTRRTTRTPTGQAPPPRFWEKAIGARVNLGPFGTGNAYLEYRRREQYGPDTDDEDDDDVSSSEE